MCIFQVNKSSVIKNTLQKGPSIADYDSLEIGLNANFSVSLNYLERNIYKNKCVKLMGSFLCVCLCVFLYVLKLDVTLTKGCSDRRSTKPGTRYHPEISYQYELTQRVTMVSKSSMTKMSRHNL